MNHLRKITLMPMHLELNEVFFKIKHKAYNSYYNQRTLQLRQYTRKQVNIYKQICWST